MKPVVLDHNCPPRFYRGGHRIRAFRGLPETTVADLREPEDWLASTTPLFGETVAGLSTLPDGQPLAEAIDADPTAWLGPEHLIRLGSDPGLLVKLLDAAERLPVHHHPDRAFAARHLGSPHGKTEAWLVLEADDDACVWLGFSEYVHPDRVRTLVDAPDDLLGLLNRLPVQPGDAIVVPAGLPHAIGAGVFTIELQEPTDFSVVLEPDPFGIDPDLAYLGLDPDTALDSIRRTPLDADGIDRLRTRWVDDTNGAESAVRSPLAPAADPYFRTTVIEPHKGTAELAAGFSVLVVVRGQGQLATSDGGTLDLARGHVCVTPYASGVLHLAGDMTVVRCQPADGPRTRNHPTADASEHGTTDRTKG